MKPNSKPEDKESLDKLMQEWQVDMPLPPRFQEQVWQRIARSEAQPEPSFRGWFTRWLELVLPRPKTAVAYVAALLVLGMAAGTVAAQVKSTHVEANLSARYVQSVNPYQAEVTQP